MKYAALFLSLLLFSHTAWAATEGTPSATPGSDKTRQIEELKDRLATKVAELTQTQKRALFGTIKDVTISSLTVETATKDVKVELNDELKVTQIIHGKRTTLSTDDLAKGDAVTVFGDYDATLEILTPRVIFIHGTPSSRTSGTVTAVDRTAFTITVTPASGAAVTVDIERSTRTVLWGGKSLAKSGFSKIQIGETVHVVGSVVAKAENRISAERIVNLGNLTGSTPQPTQTPATSPAP